MHNRSNPRRMLPLAALIVFVLVPSTPTPTPDGDPATAVEQPSEISTPTATLSEDAATGVEQPGETSTPTPESGPEATVELQFVSPSGEVPARASAAAAQPAAADLVIAPNADGWPDFNPLIMQLTLTCPPNRPPCTDPLTMRIYSNDGARFWLYSTPDEPDCGCAEVVQEYGPYSLRSYSGFSNGVFVPAGTQRRFDWSLWIQPSPASTLFVEATYGGTNQFEIALEQMRIHPLVFIPGILGTMPPTFAAEGAMDPLLGIYDPLLIHLQKTGYELNRSLFPFPVDWRESNTISADRLAAAIPGFLETANQLGYVGEPASGAPATKVDLVVHSMGGLITRTYVEGGNYHDNVGKVVFIASPHRGFPADYRTREGLTWSMYLYEGYQAALGIVMDELLWPTFVGKRYAPSDQEMAAAGCGRGPLGGWLPYLSCSPEAIYTWSHDPVRGVLSLLEMLPDDSVDPYLLCGDLIGVECTPLAEYPFEREPNPLLDGPNGLNAPHRLQALADRLGGPQNIYVIFGSGTLTDKGYFVRLGGSPFWAHGEPTEWIPADGDDLIPTYSTNLSLILPGIPAENVVELSGPTARHKEIMYNHDVLMWHVPDFLTGTAGFEPPEYSAPIPVTLELVAFVTDCPVNLTVTDPLGRRVGFDPATGGTLQEIPGAIYAAPGVEGQFVLLPNSVLGTYQLSGTAFADGRYVLSANLVTAEGITTLEIFSGEVTQGQVINFEVDNSKDPTPTPTDTPIVTDTPTDTPTVTDTPTPTDTLTPTVTDTPSVTATPTPTPKPGVTPTPISTPSLIEALDDLKEQIKDYEEDGALTERLGRGLLAKVQSARYFVRHDRNHAAAHKLEAMVHQIRALRGKEISRPAAADLIHRANVLIERLTDDDDDDDDRGDD